MKTIQQDYLLLVYYLKLAIFSDSYLRIHVSYIIEIWYSLRDGLHNYMCIISALYLKWVPSWIEGRVEIGSKWFV